MAAAVRDDAYTASRHLAGGKQVTRDLARGREANVFNEGVDLAALEQRVWTQGSSQGQVRDWDRFTWTSKTPIGTRVQSGRPDVSLHTVEIKGQTNSNGQWQYHMVPRARAAK